MHEGKWHVLKFTAVLRTLRTAISLQSENVSTKTILLNKLNRLPSLSALIPATESTVNPTIRK
jgi:hypothetical protein